MPSYSQMIKDVRKIIGDQYYYDEARGAKTNELGLTRSQVITLATDCVDYFSEVSGSPLHRRRS